MGDGTMTFKCVFCKKLSTFPLDELAGLTEAPPCPHCRLGVLVAVTVEGRAANRTSLWLSQLLGKRLAEKEAGIWPYKYDV